MLERWLAAQSSQPAGGETAGDALPPPPPADAQSAALAAMRAALTAGNPLSGRQLETRFGLTRAEATRVRELAGSNGHASAEGVN
jgi:hypothetical protein